jgi:hypothetical protein
MHDLAKGGGRKCWHLEHFQEYACMYIIMHGREAIFSNLVKYLSETSFLSDGYVMMLLFSVCMYVC